MCVPTGLKNGHEPHSSFNQTPSQQTTLTECAISITISGCLVFFLKAKGSFCLGGIDQAKRLFKQRVQRKVAIGQRLVDGIDLLEESSPSAAASRPET